MSSRTQADVETLADSLRIGFRDRDLATVREAWDGYLRLLLHNIVVAHPDILRYASSLLSFGLAEVSTTEVPPEFRYYLGALWSVMKTIDGTVGNLPSEATLRVLRSGKYSERIVRVLLESGICRATELARLVAVHKDQLVEVTQPLVDGGLVTVEQEGKYRFYSLTGEGVLAARYLARPNVAAMQRQVDTRGEAWVNLKDLVVRPIERRRRVERVETSGIKLVEEQDVIPV